MKLIGEEDLALAALLYSSGNGVAKDTKKALELYTLAGKQSFGGAQFNLGVIYANGEGSARDLVQAAGEIRPELNPEKLALQLMVTLAGSAALVKGFMEGEPLLENLEDLMNSWV